MNRTTTAFRMFFDMLLIAGLAWSITSDWRVGLLAGCLADIIWTAAHAPRGEWRR